MTFEDKINYFKENTTFSSNEEHIQNTIKQSKLAFYSSEQNKKMYYHELIAAQFKWIQKKWWVLQFLSLILFWLTLPLVIESQYQHRSMGIAAALFVILAVPELWKNRTCQSMEIEGSCYFSLRQIYATRMILFGCADVLLITFFCGITVTTFPLAMGELLYQFLLPMTITACICFGILCSKHHYSEFTAVSLSTIGNVAWWLLTQNEMIYKSISIPIWFGLFGFTLVVLGAFIVRTLVGCNSYWEVNINGNKD
jgi:hypothetical protein